MSLHRRDDAAGGGRRAWLSGLAASVAATALALVPATQASAHNVLVGSTPEDGSTVDADLAEVELVFDDTVQDQFSQVAVLDAGENIYHTGDPEAEDNVVTQAVDELPDGDYTISYRVVSADGHPVSGTVEFTVAADTALPTDAGTPSVGTSGSPSPDDTSATGEQTSAEQDQSSAPTAAATAPASSDNATPAASSGTGEGVSGTALSGLVVLALLAGLALLTLRNRQRLRRSSWLGGEDPDRGDSSTP